MKSRVDLNANELARNICSDVFGVNARGVSSVVNINADEIRNIDIDGIMSGKYGGGGSSGGPPDDPIDAALELSNIIIRSFYEKQGTDFAMGEISKQAIEDIDLPSQIEITDSIRDDTGATTIDVVISESNTWRPSVAPGRYPNGVYDILEHLNYGYSARRSIRGKWHGKKISTLKRRFGAHFYDDVIEKFMKEYGKTHGVEEVQLIIE